MPRRPSPPQADIPVDPHDAPPAVGVRTHASFLRLLGWSGGLALLWPALLNGFPLVFFDTGGYIKRVFDADLEPGRSFFYGLFLAFFSGRWFSLWGPILAQAAVFYWVARLTVRHIHWSVSGHSESLADLRAQTGAILLVVAALTGVSWYVSQLMPDIWIGMLVLCLWLLGTDWRHLNPLERLGLIGISLAASLFHMSAMALAGGLVLVIVCLRFFPGGGVLGRAFHPLPPAATLLAALILMPLLHGLLLGKPVYTPGGPVFIFGRLVQDGLAQRYLAAHCPDSAVKLCAYQAVMPSTADDFIWHENSPFRAIGWWDGAGSELAALNRAIFFAYPEETLGTGLRSSWLQMQKFATGDGLDEWHEATRWTIKTYLPQQTHWDFTAARQQNAGFSRAFFDRLNRWHRPVGALSLAGLVILGVQALKRRQHRLACLCFYVLLALIGNAIISGALSNPHDRYQSRMIWLPTLIAIAIAIAMAARTRHAWKSCEK
jgi:hypothetical protein